MCYTRVLSHSRNPSFIIHHICQTSCLSHGHVSMRVVGSFFFHGQRLLLLNVYKSMDFMYRINGNDFMGFFKFRLKANATLNIMYTLVYSIDVMMTMMIIIIIISINSLIYLSLPPVMFRQSSNFFFGVTY